MLLVLLTTSVSGVSFLHGTLCKDGDTCIHEPRCTNMLRVCNDNEIPQNVSGELTCRPNKLKRNTLRLFGQNWDSGILNALVRRAAKIECWNGDIVGMSWQASAQISGRVRVSTQRSACRWPKSSSPSSCRFRSSCSSIHQSKPMAQSTPTTMFTTTRPSSNH